MAEIFKIKGGKPLEGELAISGSKNAALPIIAASILNSGTTILENVPLIKDVLHLVEILRMWGAQIQVDESGHRLIINNSGLKPNSSTEVNELIRKLRGSILVVGPSLAKFNEIKWSEIARRAIEERINDLEVMNRIASKSKLTKKDVDEISRKIKRGIAKRHGLI